MAITDTYPYDLAKLLQEGRLDELLSPENLARFGSQFDATYYKNLSDSAIRIPTDQPSAFRELKALREFRERNQITQRHDVAIKDIALTEDVWRTVNQVNRMVNKMIHPLTDDKIERPPETLSQQVLGNRPIDYHTDNPPMNAENKLVGDCDDYLLTKRRMLKQLGIDDHTMSFAYVDDRRDDDSAHAVLLIHTDKGDLVLDNLTDEIKPWHETKYAFASFAPLESAGLYGVRSHKLLATESKDSALHISKFREYAEEGSRYALPYDVTELRITASRDEPLRVTGSDIACSFVKDTTIIQRSNKTQATTTNLEDAKLAIIQPYFKHAEMPWLPPANTLLRVDEKKTHPVHLKKLLHEMGIECESLADSGAVYSTITDPSKPVHPNDFVRMISHIQELIALEVKGPGLIITDANEPDEIMSGLETRAAPKGDRLKAPDGIGGK